MINQYQNIHYNDDHILNNFYMERLLNNFQYLKSTIFFILDFLFEFQQHNNQEKSYQ